MSRHALAAERGVEIHAGPALPAGDLVPPTEPAGVVVFAHGAGSGRGSPRNRAVAAELIGDGLATLLIDLLTESDDIEDRETGRWRFDIELLGKRVVATIDWLRGDETFARLPIGCFEPPRRGPITSQRSCRAADRSDLAHEALERVRAPTLLIVGGLDAEVIELNRGAAARLPSRLEVVPGATHLFEEPGALERVAEMARDWFVRHFEPEDTRRRAALTRLRRCAGGAPRRRRARCSARRGGR